jgi:exo-beta-1,3-glucanase (GH17 family)
MTVIIPALAALVACGSGGGDDHSGNPSKNPVNNPPAVTDVAISPANPRVGDTLAATARVNDVDGNLKEVVFAWYLGTALVQKITINVTGSYASPGNLLANQALTANDAVKCEVTAYDSIGANFARSASVTIAPAPAKYRLPMVCLSPYKPGQSPAKHTPISEQQIREMLAIIAPYVRGVRIFGMLDGLELIPRIAKEEYGLEVMAGIWLDQSTEPEGYNEKGLANLVAAVKAGYVDIASIGNEVLLFQYIEPLNEAENERQLLEYIQRVRQETAGTNVPVTTVESYSELLLHPNVIAACDILAVNIYPFWEGISVDYAAGHIYRSFFDVMDAGGGKPVLIAETGWPSAGNPWVDAVPSRENAAAFVLNVASMCRAEGMECINFEAFDELWKEEETVGPHWGIWDAYGVLKPGMELVFNGETVPDNWSCSAPIGGPGIPGIQLTTVPPYGDDAGIVRGMITHVAPIDHVLTAYIKVGSGWWVKPYADYPTAAINCDGSFAIGTVTGGIDYQASEIRLYLVPAGYKVPVGLGVPEPPSELASNAIVIVSIVRDTDGGIAVTTLKPSF